MNFTTAKFLSRQLITDIKNAACEHGFDRCEFVRPLIPQRDQESYQSWIDRGSHAGMAYLSRQMEGRKNPSLLYPDKLTVMTLGISYFQGELPKKPGPGFGRVARYAWGLDYHDVIISRVHQFMDSLMPLMGSDIKWTCTTDSKPLLERSLAHSSGMGFFGKNTLLISPRLKESFHVGSFLFLAEVLMTISLDDETKAIPVNNGCGSCQSCLTQCPTNALVEPYHLSSGRCISYLTIENKESIPEELRPLLGDWVFGCDICQDVCPYNERARLAQWPEFGADSGVGAWISLEEILAIPDESVFKKRFEKTPLLRAKRRGLMRNACVAAGNSHDNSFAPMLKPLLHDPDVVIKSHAQWALNQLS